jgi:hypothetical protein
MERMNKIQLGLDFHLEERKQYENILSKYIHLFTISYKDLREVTMKQHKIELLPNAKLVRI